VPKGAACSERLKCAEFLRQEADLQSLMTEHHLAKVERDALTL